MPWAIRGNRACCMFCKREYVVYDYYNGPTWDKCNDADREKKRIKNAKNREYNVRQKALRGLEVTPRPPRIKRPRAEMNRQEEQKGVYIKTRTHICRKCGIPTVNYWHCPDCLGRLSSAVDMDFYIEPGYSRRLGHRVEA